MLFNTALLGGLMLAGHAAAHANRLLRRGDDIDHLLRKDANLATLTARQNANPVDQAPRVSTTPATGSPSQVSDGDLAEWDANTRAACSNALDNLNGRASNPAGIAICYNLPFLDNQTGVFWAEVRLYRISEPINPWENVDIRDISVTMSYLGAEISAMDTSLTNETSQQGDGATELKTLNFAGRINDNIQMGPEELREFLVPEVELVAPQGAGQLKETLSSQEASFVNGVFANTTSVTRTANAAASASAAVLSSTKFHLPGTNLAFFPIGLVITCIWTGGFLIAVGGGTMGRIQFREQYRRRLKREMAAGFSTF